MAEKNQYADIHDYKGKVESYLKKIQESETLSESVKKNFLEWKSEQVRTDLKIPTICKNIDKGFNLLKLFPPKKEINEFTKEDINKAVEKIMEEGKYTDWTRSLYKRTIKTFFKFAGRGELVADIKTGVKKCRQKIPEELLSEEDILKLIDKCESHRDRALITTLYESGCRIGELGSIRLKDLEFRDSEATVILTGKTGMRKVLLQFCIPYLRKYLEVHPFWNKKENKAGDKDAFLFLGTRNKGQNKPLEYQAIRTQIQKIVKRAGINKPCNPHHFRHSRASFLARFLTESQLNYVFGWEQGSEMPSIYVHLTGRDVNDSLRQVYGGKPKETKPSTLTPKKCEICGETNESNAELCQKCNNPLSIKGAVEKSIRSQGLEERLACIEGLLERWGTKFDRFFEENTTDRDLKEIREKVLVKQRSAAKI